MEAGHDFGLDVLESWEDSPDELPRELLPEFVTRATQLQFTPDRMTNVRMNESQIHTGDLLALSASLQRRLVMPSY